MVKSRKKTWPWNLGHGPQMRLKMDHTLHMSGVFSMKLSNFHSFSVLRLSLRFSRAKALLWGSTIIECHHPMQCSQKTPVNKLHDCQIDKVESIAKLLKVPILAGTAPTLQTIKLGIDNLQSSTLLPVEPWQAAST